MGDTGVDPMESARYMAEISNRMQVPDRIMVSGDEQGGAATAPSPSRAAGEGKYNDLGMRQRDPRIDMQARILYIYTIKGLPRRIPKRRPTR